MTPWADLIPRRWAHFGAVNYTFWRWLGREFHRKPTNMTFREWIQK
jgi:hypothetical protein